MRHFSTVPFSGTPEQEGQLKAWLDENKDTPGVVMPALQKAQEIYGYLPIEVQRMVAEALGKPLAEIYGVATFYSQFSLTPKGKYRISVCLGTACYVKGSGKLYEKAAGEAGHRRRRVHGGRQVQPGRLPLRGRLRPGPGADGERRRLRPPDGGRPGRHPGEIPRLTRPKEGARCRNFR